MSEIIKNPNDDIIWYNRWQTLKDTAVKITLFYLIVGLLWIVFSDRAASLLVKSKDSLTIISTFKGWFYVFVTSVILYSLLIRNFKKVHQAEMKLVDSYSELSATYEELGAVNEELRVSRDHLTQQYLELEESQTQTKISEERYRLATEGARDVIWDWDLKIDKLYLSKRWGLKNSPEGDNNIQVHCSWADILHPQDIETFNISLKNCLENKNSFYQDSFRFLTTGGETRWVSVRGATIFSECGNPVRMAGSITDITDQVIFQEELKRAKLEAEAANKAKSVFLANMSHELRTPLNGIIGPAELLQNAALGSEQHEFVDMIKISADHLLNLINDLLDISKIESGRLEFKKKQFSLPRLVQEVHNSFKVTAELKELNFVTSINGNIPDFVIGDEVKLKQILNNLLNNAIKFTKTGQVSLTVRLIDQVDEHVKLGFEIKDTGIGINHEDISKLFSRFTQLDHSYKKRFSGTGLGLSICKEILDTIGGEIWVESVLGEGSCFYFKIGFKLPPN